MARLACPCGNILWNGCDENNPQCTFYPWEELQNHMDDLAFFELDSSPETRSLDIWQCWECDRLMVFDDPNSNRVTRWFKRVCADDFPIEKKDNPHEIGVFFNDAFFDTVCRKLDLEEGSDKYSLIGMKFDPAEKLLSPRVMMEKFFGAVNEKVRNWWLSEHYADWIVLYDAFDFGMNTPLKAWRRYKPDWSVEG
ncbi:hypothetical protein [Collinsella tanakaei]|uniref:hypothetical protein n=1 Tax=Collinsella tanakaei TaxID=626935 RepID=UPI0025A36A96|nr:hypothetical protein [Collinsella tanakaei]MDM8301019.1 hypothetical protein [Collinsella tanakaei]